MGSPRVCFDERLSGTLTDSTATTACFGVRFTHRGPELLTAATIWLRPGYKFQTSNAYPSCAIQLITSPGIIYPKLSESVLPVKMAETTSLGGYWVT